MSLTKKCKPCILYFTDLNRFVFKGKWRRLCADRFYYKNEREKLNKKPPELGYKFLLPHFTTTKKKNTFNFIHDSKTKSMRKLKIKYYYSIIHSWWFYKSNITIHPVLLMLIQQLISATGCYEMKIFMNRQKKSESKNRKTKEEHMYFDINLHYKDLFLLFYLFFCKKQMKWIT